jgi:hypothetical protein
MKSDGDSIEYYILWHAKVMQGHKRAQCKAKLPFPQPKAPRLRGLNLGAIFLEDRQQGFWLQSHYLRADIYFGCETGSILRHLCNTKMQELTEGVLWHTWSL